MRKLLLAALFCLLASTQIQADTFVILPSGELAFNTSFSTQGVFTCSLCTGSGTNSVTFGSGGNTVTLTFTGVTTTNILVGAEAVSTNVGQIQVAATGSGFVFPTNTPNAVSVFFNLIVTQTSPAAGTGTVNFGALANTTTLNFNTLIRNYVVFPSGPNPPGFSYSGIAYTVDPFSVPNFNSIVNLNADLSAIPEPMSLLLLGSGVGTMMACWRKRLSRQ
jgi:hypothetical protein